MWKDQRISRLCCGRIDNRAANEGSDLVSEWYMRLWKDGNCRRNIHALAVGTQTNSLIASMLNSVTMPIVAIQLHESITESQTDCEHGIQSQSEKKTVRLKIESRWKTFVTTFPDSGNKDHPICSGMPFRFNFLESLNNYGLTVNSH